MPLASDVDINAGQRPDEDPSLAVRNNGGTEPVRRAGPGRPPRGAAAAVLRRPRGARGRDAVPRERHPRPRHPAGAARGGRRALPPLRRRQPDQRPEQGADRRAREGVRRGRHRAADLLGQPQLGALRRGHLAADGRRRHRARLRVRDLGLRLVLRLPAVPRGHRPGRAAVRPAAARPRRSCRTTSTPRASCGPTPTRWPPRWRRSRTTSATPPAWSRRRTASRTRWPPSPGRRGTPTSRADGGGAGRGRRGGARPVVRPGVAEPQRAAVRAVAGAGRQRPPAGAGRGGGEGGRRLPGRLRQRPPRGDLGPRQRGEGDGGRARAGLRAGRRRRARTRRSSRWCGNCSRSVAPGGCPGWAPTARPPAVSCGPRRAR